MIYRTVVLKENPGNIRRKYAERSDGEWKQKEFLGWYFCSSSGVKKEKNLLIFYSVCPPNTLSHEISMWRLPQRGY